MKKQNKNLDKQFKLFSIKNKMVSVFILFAVSLLTVICIISVYLASFSLMRNTEYFINELAEGSSKVLNERADSIFKKLDTFSNMPIIQDKGISYSQKIDFFKNELQMLKQSGWLSFGISGLDGILHTTDDKEENIKNAEWFKSVIKGKYVITEPKMSLTKRKYVSIIAIPLRDLQGKIVGTINASILGDSLSNLISDIIVGKTGQAYLISPSGIILGSRRPEILYKNFFAEILNSKETDFSIFLKDMLASKKSAVQVSKINGIKHISALSTMRYSGWKLLITAPSSEFISENVSNFLNIFILVALCGILIAVLIGFFTANNIVKPINKVIEVLKNISQGEGDLTVRLPLIGNNEITELSEYFNRTIAKIGNSIQSVGLNSRSMAEIGSNLASNMNRTADSVHEITENINGVKQQALTQAASVTETSATIEQIIKTIKQLNASIENQAESVSRSSASIEQMTANIASITQTLEKTDGLIKTLAESTEDGKETVSKSNRVTQKIAEESGGLLEASSVIQHIASQTNLLAMNAAIEAAHAGEAGKGFAVVADEIRKLAEESSAQGKTITATLKALSGEIDSLSASSRTAEEKFGLIFNLSEQVKSMSESLTQSMREQGNAGVEILNAIRNINSVTFEVRNGSAEMLSGGEQVAEEMTKLDELTRKITLSMNEMASSAVQISNAMQEVNEITQKNKTSIENLAFEVNKFKV
ncbi:methyl-accepting chemotaxis protein [Treponema sp. OMZ 787]|uniref:methyl-accepting chemotaxis protein n=1 Tax=Treponema sp. OMZ 787 TaxID=2563669 RepID=UPI0020A57BB6|nr:methyl-accepting chemotaxis protein [Treponema sp. OMZ 787]UTC63471.1 methyl-accepting chemotaxis protein [Treponema sp. OMZ 787]